ncbi:hypothetical protein ACE193_25275 [Bernardetia sp. OM2101]|uniref:hypothetical protein n=1 Tax=Bernardetia sp. OM2101 TaxID=3344876 RepID=UPI0035CF3082
MAFPIYCFNSYKTICDDGQIEIDGGIMLLADLAFLGIDKDYENAISNWAKLFIG